MTVASSDLKLNEAAAPAGVVSSRGQVLQPDGTVLIHIIRPCVGKGRGRHVYEADMLAKHGDHFSGWPMYVDHESPEATRRAGGLPPSLSRLGGEVLESWWDPTVPAEGRFGQGAVVGRVMPSPMIRDLIQTLPNQVQASINTHATGVKATRRDGRPAAIVEGFAPEGSVDWVTKAGAGGKVVQLMEAYYEGDDETPEQHELAEYLREHLPAVAEALINPEPNHGENNQEDDVKPEELREAVHTELRTDETRQIIAEAVQEAVGEAIRDTLPAAIGAAAEVVEEQATAAARAEVRNGRLAERAAALIAESELHDAFKADVAERFTTVELADDTDDEGKVTKTAEAKLEEAVKAELEKAAKLQEAVAGPAPARRRATSVTGQGGGSVQEHELREDVPQDGEWKRQMQEAGIDWKAAYGVKVQEADADKPAERENEPAAA